METKNCQNCKIDFAIETDDTAFYRKINVPPPTFCPPCRLQRRLLFRNEKKLYKRKCDLTGKDIISVYPADAPFPVYDVREFFSDHFDASQYAREYDFSRSFFEQLKELYNVVPHASLTVDYPTLVNSDYTNEVGHIKNCYLISEADFSENCAYGSGVTYCRDSYDTLMGKELELCYESINCRKCNKAYFSEDCEDCINVSFSKNLVGCSNCVGCVNLRKKQYHIFNKPYLKEDYFKKLEGLQLNSFDGAEVTQGKARAFWEKFPQKYMHGRQNFNASGDYVHNAKNALYCNDVANAENCKYCNIITVPTAKDCWDYTLWGNNAELLYECLGVGEAAQRIKFSLLCWVGVSNIEYSIWCFKSSNLFGCVGLKNKQYCIFNMQYSKEEYFALRDKIVAHMNEMPYVSRVTSDTGQGTRGIVYRYGEFFPAELSPFCYNETNAQEFFPLDKQEALKRGFSWREEETKSYAVTIQPDDLPLRSTEAGENILQAVIGCAHNNTCDCLCSGAFKLIPMELKFYQSQHLPLPRLCPNCRHHMRIKRRNPIRFQKRQCQCGGKKSENDAYDNLAAHLHGETHCEEQFITAYAPENKTIVYCEQCYQSEVA